jgi:predicted GTPase
LVSSKTGEGIKNLINILKDTSKKKKQEGIQRKLFFIGSVNSGKSSLINILLKECSYLQK